jgi:hypothetical protein
MKVCIAGASGKLGRYVVEHAPFAQAEPIVLRPQLRILGLQTLELGRRLRLTFHDRAWIARSSRVVRAPEWKLEQWSASRSLQVLARSS